MWPFNKIKEDIERLKFRCDRLELSNKILESKNQAIEYRKLINKTVIIESSMYPYSYEGKLLEVMVNESGNVVVCAKGYFCHYVVAVREKSK